MGTAEKSPLTKSTVGRILDIMSNGEKSDGLTFKHSTIALWAVLILLCSLVGWMAVEMRASNRAVQAAQIKALEANIDAVDKKTVSAQLKIVEGIQENSQAIKDNTSQLRVHERNMIEDRIARQYMIEKIEEIAERMP